MILKKIKNYRDKVLRTITPSQKTLSICGVTILSVTVFFFIATQFADFGSSINLIYLLLYLCLFLLAGGLLAWAGSLLLGIAGKTPKIFRLAVLLAVLCVFYYFYIPKAYGRVLLLLLVVLPSFIAPGIYQWRKGELFPLSGAKRYLVFCLFVIGIVGFVTGMGFYLYPGSPAEPLKNVKMSGPHIPATLEATDPSEKGLYEIGRLTYGSGTDKRRTAYRDSISMETEPVDGSLLLESWKGTSGKLRSWYFGFDATELPLNARVWYPKDRKTTAPLVLIVHGNHLAQDFSESGYAYLGELLASRGYIVVSADENFMNSSITDFEHFGNGLRNENGARGWLLLKHLEQWRKWNDDTSNMFYDRVDMDRIALIGHSRGGEAVGHAALFNRLPSFPDNANVAFDFNFNIRSVVAIAPVDGQYKPSSVLTIPENINYFVLQGTHDMDMRSYGGLATYKRVKFSPEFNGFKAGVYIHRANHGQFNTSWGKKDGISPGINRFNLNQLLDKEEQQQVAKVYISAFLDITLRDNAEYKPLFMDYRYARHWLPDLVYLSQFENSKTFKIADFEEDMNLESTTLHDGNISTENLSVWKEKQQQLMWKSHITKAVHIGWDHSQDTTLTGTYTITLPDSLPLSPAKDFLVFSLVKSDESPAHPKNKDDDDKATEADSEEDKQKEPSEEEPVDFTIELSDRQGEKISFPLSTCNYLQPQIEKNITKFAFLNASQDTEVIPDFFYFDIARLAAKTSFDADQLKQIRFIFDRRESGVIILDDLGLMEKDHEQGEGSMSKLPLVPNSP